MNRKHFFHLYVNLNSLVELSLRRNAAQLLASLPSSISPPELTPEEAEAQMMKTFENLDMSALDQVWENLDNTPLDLETLAEGATLEEPPGAITPSTEVECRAPAADDASDDLDVYMQRAYEYEGVLRERIDRLFAKADLITMSRQVEQLSGTPPLTALLNGAQMAEWLERYASEDATLTDLATEMRRLEMAG